MLTVTYTGPDATDLGYLLHKNPRSLQSFDLGVGRAHVFYPEATPARCTVALFLEVDPIGLVRNRRFTGGEAARGDAGSLGDYVNDRPYASSSMLAVALGSVFRTAMTGRSKERPELAQSAIPLEITVTALPSRGGPDLPARLFEPLGWTVAAAPIPLDTEFPEWGDSRYVRLTLTGSLRLAAALHHLYVLLPVLDDSKHYWVSDDEVGKLLRAGDGWLHGHPDRELITRRYLKHQRPLVADAMTRLAELDDAAAPDAPAPDAEPPVPAATPLQQLRADAVLAALRDVGAHRVADLGCGEGALLRRLLPDASFTEIIGTDVSPRSLAAAASRLGLAELGERQAARIRLVQSSLTYEDDRLAGLDAAVLMEVVEHIDPSRLDALESAVFSKAHPKAVIVTTPNAEYNALYPSLATGQFRHPDHRFEWTRAEFAAWADRVGRAHGYSVVYRAVGDTDATVGSPTQLALFRTDAS